MFAIDELLHAKSAIHDEARFAHEEKHKFQPRKWKTLEATRTASDPLLHEAKTYTKENTLTSDTNFNSMTSQPTHEEDGDVWRYIICKSNYLCMLLMWASVLISHSIYCSLKYIS